MPEIGPPEFAQEPRTESPGEEAYELANMLLPAAAWIGLELHRDALAINIADVLRWLKEKWKP
jgi:hypothetical protein